ncbi:hypothetical protein ABZP36_018616 [Zizania latifolia]
MTPPPPLPQDRIIRNRSALAHRGMMFVLIGYTFEEGMFEIEEHRGDSPYGRRGVFSGDGCRMPSELELALAEHYGK